MKHHVTCAICAKQDFIPVGNGVEKEAGWFYGGKVNIKMNQKSKPKLVEYWECPKCSQPRDDKAPLLINQKPTENK